MQTVELTGSAIKGIATVVPAGRAAGADLPTTVKLGRLAPATLPRCLPLGNYFDSADMAAPPPPSINRRDKAAASLARMYLNDRFGCCVVSGKGHNFGLWSANDSDSGGEVLASDAEIQSQYFSWCGPGDNGCYIDRVLTIIKDRGMILGGKTHKIDGFVSLDWTNKTLVQTAQYLFGATSIGFDLPQAWLNSDVWDVTNSGTVGGHDVSPIDYDERGVYVSSWGRIYLMTWAAFLSRRWIGEAYVMLAPLWYGSDQRASAAGIDVAKLRADLAKIGGGVIPDVDPVPPGPVPPGPVPPTPPAPPVPTTFSVSIPQQPVRGGFFSGYHVPAFTVQGVVGGETPPVPTTLPPWLKELLRLACSGAVVLPPPWSVLVSLLCGLIPKGELATAGPSTVTIPPWLLPVLHRLCQQAATLPAPWGLLVQLACAFLPPAPTTASPCGCK